jgi:hypothetical protein
MRPLMHYRDIDPSAAANVLINMAYTGPVVIPEDPGACHLIELLQLKAAYLADLAVLDLDLGIIAKHNYHPKKD